MNALKTSALAGAVAALLALAGCGGAATPAESPSPTPAGPGEIADAAAVDWENATVTGFSRCLFEGDVTFSEGTATVEPTVQDEVFEDLDASGMAIGLAPERAESLPLGPDGRLYAAVPFDCLPEGGTTSWDSGYVVVGQEGEALTAVGTITAEASQAGDRELTGVNRILAHSAVPPAGYRFQEQVQREGDSNAILTGRAWSVWGWDEAEQAVTQLVRSETMGDTVLDYDNAVILEAPGGRGAIAGTSPEDPEAAFAAFEERLGTPESTDSPDQGPPLDDLGYTSQRNTWGGFSATLVSRDENAEEMYFQQCLSWTVDPREGEIPANVVVAAGLRPGVSLSAAGYTESQGETRDESLGPQYTDLSGLYDPGMARVTENTSTFLVETTGVPDGEVLAISDGTTCMV